MTLNGFYALLTTTTELKTPNYDESDDEEDVEMDNGGPAARPLAAKVSL